jgi:hypothetical protein
MVTLREGDRRRLTAGVLRVSKASAVVATSALSGRWSFELLESDPQQWEGAKLWDGNEAVGAIRFGVQRATLASAEQARGLCELARSATGYTVALATLARGSLEALSRVNWVVSSRSGSELLTRHASLEYADLRYPAQHGLEVHNVAGSDRLPVDDYRTSIEQALLSFGAQVQKKVGITDLVTDMLSEIYNEGPRLYSGLSASAHAHGWATGNFFDPKTLALQPDHQMVIEYCQYVIDSTIQVTDRFIRAFRSPQGDIDRWAGVRDPVSTELDQFFQKRDRV